MATLGETSSDRWSDDEDNGDNEAFGSVQGGAIEHVMNDRRYAMNVSISGMAFWREPQSTWEKIGSLVPGLEMMFGGPGDDDTAKQVQELEMLISQRVSGLVVFSNDPDAVAPAIDKAVEKGIPVVTAFADVPKSKRLAHIGTNQMSLARAIAKQVKDDFQERFAAKRPSGERPKALVVVGKRTSQDQAERAKGIEAEIADSLQLIDTIEDRFDKDIAKDAIVRAFQTYGEIDVIFGCNSQSAIGAVEALKRPLKKQPGQVVVTGWDTERMVMEQIAGDSWIHATAVLYSSYMVQLCFALLEAENCGYLYPDMLNTRELHLPAVPKKIEIPMKDVVTSKNVEEYLKK